MKYMLLKFGCFFFVLFVFINTVFAQPTPVGAILFVNSSKSTSRMEDSLKKQFEKQNLIWPPQSLYLRSFKYDRQLEIWVKSSTKEPYKLFKT